jgi:transposase
MVFKGNTADPKTLLPQIDKVMTTFGLRKLVIVGDRGMISQTQINELKKKGGIDWVTALKSGAISKLVSSEHIQLGLFDERNLFELEHPDFPGERLVACRNPELAKLRAHKRRSLLEATSKELSRVKAMVSRGRLSGKDQIGVRVGKVINQYKLQKHFVLDIMEKAFDFRVDQENVDAEAALDGIYVLRTSLAKERLSADDTVRTYKRLSDVERAFRSMKSIDIEVRPIRHRLENRVRAHILLCMLARYVSWHMIEALRPMLFADEDQEAKATRNPVAPAKRSAAALKKISTKATTDGAPAHSFRTLLGELSSIVRNTCRRPGDATATFDLITTPSTLQQRAFDLLATIAV